MKRIQLSICIISLLLASCHRAEAQQSEPLSQLDSLLWSIEQRSGYYIPRNATDSTLLSIVSEEKLGSSSALVEYLRTASLGARPTMLSSKLSLPLVLQTRRLEYLRTPRSYLSLHSDSLRWSLSEAYHPRPMPHALQIANAVPKSLRVEMQLVDIVLQALQSSSLEYFHYLSPQEDGGQRLALANHTDLKQGFGSRKIQVETMEQVAQNMRIQEIEQRFWQPSFESSIQFSQSHVSENWYKGGSSNLNLYMRTYGALTYTKDKIKWKNELEDKLSIYNMDKSERSSGRSFRIADDQIRLATNFGLRASKRWYYTLDAEARTQLLTSYKGDTDDVQSSPLAPLTLNVGLGMKYDFVKKYASVYQRKVLLSMNFAPLSYTYRTTIRRDIDLARHGLSVSKPYYHNIGSTFRLSMQWDINMNVSWSSKLYFNTSYTNVEAEWENTLNMKIGRFFSTRINLQLRYDDAVSPSRSWNKYLQYNELLSFGFNYKF